MRFWLITALVALFIGQVFSHAGAPSKRIVLLPGGYPDGTLITIYFMHDGYVHDFRPVQAYRPKDAAEAVRLRFFDKDSVSDPDWPDEDCIEIKADKEPYKHVGSNTRLKKEWRQETRMDQVTDRVVPTKGHWKIEIYKLDDFHLSVFFENYHAGVRRFDRFLGDTQSIYLLSDNVELSTIQVTIELSKDSLISPLNVDQFYGFFNGKPNSDHLATFRSWPINGYIEMTVSMRVSGDFENRQPNVEFTSTNGGQFFLSVYQLRQNAGIGYSDYAETWLTSKLYNHDVMDYSRANKGLKLWWQWKPSAEQLHDICKLSYQSGSYHHNGDMQHLRFERINTNTVKMQIGYKHPYGKQGVECIRTIPEHLVAQMDGPFDVVSNSGAVVFHMTSSLKIVT